jgi:hypothetical protein
MKRWAGFSERNFSEVLTKFMFARMEHLPSAMHVPELLQLQQLSIPFARVDSVKRHFGIRRAFLMLAEK